MIRIGISGFGRIGRLAARVALRRGDMEVVAINAPDKTPEQIAYVFSHDSVHGPSCSSAAAIPPPSAGAS